MPVRSGWLSPDSQSREDTRLIALGALTPTSAVQVRSGILPGSSTGLYRINGFTLTGTTGTMSGTVSPGRAIVQSTDTRGAYPIALTEFQNVTFTDGDALYDRIDLLVLRIYDDVYDSSGRTEAVVEIVRGTPAAVPAIPATPTSPSRCTRSPYPRTRARAPAASPGPPPSPASVPPRSP